MKSFNKPHISVVIINYNGKKLLEVSLPSIIKQSYIDYEIIVVDNGSNDDSLQFIKDNYPDIRILNSPINSFSAGNNIGIRSSRGEYIFVLNNDVEVDSDCLNELMEVVNNSKKDVGMWATKILNYYDRKIIDNTGLIIYPDGLSRGRGRLEVDNGQYDRVEEICIPSGCAAIYKKEMLDAIGLFDETFTFYGEDSDLGLRGRIAGWKCLYVPKAKIYHMYSATTGQYSTLKAFLVERNRLWIAVKNYPLPLLFLNPFFALKRYLYQIFGVLNGKGAVGMFVNEFSKKQLVFILLKAWFFALKGMPKALKQRRAIFKSKRVSSNEIYSWFKKYGISAKEISLKK